MNTAVSVAVQYHCKPLKVFHQRPRDFYRVRFPGRSVKSRLRPQLLAHQRQRVGEGRVGFVVPGRLANGIRGLRHSLMHEQRDEREQAQERG